MPGIRQYSGVNADLETAGTDALRGTAGTHLNVVLAYEDFYTGMHALRTFDHLFLLAEQRARIGTQNVWKFDLLEIKKLREIAAAEASHADMVIISAYGPGNLPRGVLQWIEKWVGERKTDIGALVMLIDGASRKSDQRLTVETYLEECARRARMDFFNQKTEGRHGREERQPAASTQQDWQAFEILTQIGSGPSSFSRWGDQGLALSF